MKEAYNNGLINFPEGLTHHFPNMETGLVIYVSGGNIYSQYINQFNIVYEFKNSDARKIIKKIEDNSVVKYPIASSCFRIINNSNEYPHRQRRLTKSCDNDLLLPVPDMRFADTEIIPDKFFTDGVVYIIDAAQGKFLDDYYLSPDGAGLSEDWKHGYTR